MRSANISLVWAMFVSLCVCAIVTVVCLPLTVGDLAYRVWIYGQLLCKLAGYLQGEHLFPRDVCIMHNGAMARISGRNSKMNKLTSFVRKCFDKIDNTNFSIADIHCVSKKFTLLVFTITRCWPILIIFGRNVAEEICSKRLYYFHFTVKHTCMNINFKHNKTKNVITQLRHATHGERRNTVKYPNIS